MSRGELPGVEVGPTRQGDRDGQVGPVRLVGATGTGPVVVQWVDGRISRIMPAPLAQPRAPMPVLGPALTDYHVHKNSNDLNAMFLCNSVVSVRNLAGTPWHRSPEAGIGSDMLQVSAGPVIDGPQRDPALTWPHVAVCASPDAARAEVDTQLRGGFRIIKTYSSIAIDVLRAVCKRAHEAGALVTGHCPTGATASEAVVAGMDGLEHMDWLFTGHLTDEHRRARRSLLDRAAAFDSRELRYQLAWVETGGIDWGQVARTAERLADAGTSVCPTLSIYRRSFQVTDEALLDPRIAEVPGAMAAQWLPQRDHRFRGMVPDWPRWVDIYRRRLSVFRRAVFTMHEAGVTLLAGTDTPNPFVVPGYSLTQEVALMREAGLPHQAAIASATQAGADWMGDPHHGRIAEGARAYFVVTEEDPSTTLNAFHDPLLVVGDGRRLRY